MLRVVINLKSKLKIMGKTKKWLHNIDSHPKGKSRSLKEVLGTKCFEISQDWMKVVSLPTDRRT